MLVLSPTGLLHSHPHPFPDLLPSTTRIDPVQSSVTPLEQSQVGCPWRLHLCAAGWPSIPAESCSLYCGRSGSFRCSPPRLTATQLLQVLLRPSVPKGRGLSPRKGALLCSAQRGQLCPRWGARKENAISCGPSCPRSKFGKRVAGIEPA